MLLWSRCNSGLYDWWHTKPPVVVFVLTLVACSLTLATITVYVDMHKHNLPNPNVKDWNTFYDYFSKIEICLPAEDSSNDQSVRGSETVSPTIVSANISSFSVLVGMLFNAHGSPSLGSSSGGDPLSLLQHQTLQLSVTEEMLGQKVSMGDQPQSLLVSFSLPSPTTRATRPNHPKKSPPRSGRAAGQETTKTVAVATAAEVEPTTTGGSDGTGSVSSVGGAAVDVQMVCVTFSGPSKMLPNSQVTPTACKPMNQSLPPLILSASCSPAGGSPVYGLQMQQQGHLTPLLSQEETVLIQLHLVYTTCALVLLVVLLMGYAVCRRCAAAAASTRTGSDHYHYLLYNNHNNAAAAAGTLCGSLKKNMEV